MGSRYHDMIKAHRSHGAVMIWGLCNEAMCGVENGAAAAAFMKVKNALDPDRPQTGNFVGGQHYNFPHVDIIGESSNQELNWWHRLEPTTPITTGEHGFGNNELLYSRGEDDRQLARLGTNVSRTFDGKLHNITTMYHNRRVRVPGAGWGNLKPKQTVPFLLSSHGLGMWAMTDYYGEAFMGWPTFVKSRGHLDVAGFPRSTAWWFRTNFLANTDPNIPDYQRPLVGGSWDVQVRALTPCQMFASTPSVEVWRDGRLHGTFAVPTDYGLLDLRDGATWPPPAGPSHCTITLAAQDSQSKCALGQSFGCYNGIEGFWVDQGCRGTFDVNGAGTNVSCACKGSQGFCSTRFNCSAVLPCSVAGTKNTTVVGLVQSGAETGVGRVHTQHSQQHRVAGSHTLLAAGPATRMEMVLDVPSIATGTGEALFLDGQDVAFVRVQLVDDAGTISRISDANVTYAVVKGPVSIVGVGSGAIANHQHSQGTVYETWQGLGRVVVQVTVDCTGQHRSLARSIDVEAVAGAYADACPDDGGAVISATTAGFTTTITIPVSGDPKHSPLAVARATKSLDTYTYFDDVQP